MFIFIIITAQLLGTALALFIVGSLDRNPSRVADMSEERAVHRVRHWR